MQENNVKQAIENYIKSDESRNALLIKGEWGSGKTFFIKNEVKDMLQKLGFYMIYVPLSGINNREQLMKTILTKVILGDEENEGKANWKQKISFFTERISRFFGSYNKIDSFLTIFDLSDFIKLDKVIICFDDLERIGSKYPISELIEFINSQFVEHKGYKVILIGDESKKQLQSIDYHLVKEKLIGWTVEFTPNLQIIIQRLYKNYDGKTEYFNFLCKHEKLIKELIISFNQKNIRTITFFLESLKIILDFIEDKYDLIEQDIIYFTFIISNEYKKGKLHLIERLDSIPHFITNETLFGMYEFEMEGSFVNQLNKGEQEAGIEKYEKEFNDYKQSRFVVISDYRIKYIFFDSIFNFITKGYLDKDSLRKQLDEITKKREPNKITSEILILDRLENFQKLTNQEFEDQLSIANKTMTQGGFNIYEFTRISFLLLKFVEKGIINSNEEEIKKLLQENVNKAIENTDYIKASVGEDYIDFLEKKFPELANEIITSLNKLLADRRRKEIHDKFKDWKNNIHDKELNRAIITYVPAKEIVNFLLENIENRLFLEKLIAGFRESFKNSSVSSDDIDKLTKINDELEKLEDQVQSVNKYWVSGFIFQIQKIIESIERKI